ncbi:hypothetical protein ALC60_00905 [Trachymyrmex zeteki]|uniref:Uncharacterized protein n=1 Tax=Mycetomoellerius zeteki TaxID=64791 RepID=A0A151XID7_9HYME|nr:hypothetical protein ALC60_00905 [Trachymyrmex zeteki]
MEIRLSFGAGFTACFSDINGPKCQGRLSLLQRGCFGSISRRTLTGISEKETRIDRLKAAKRGLRGDQKERCREIDLSKRGKEREREREIHTELEREREGGGREEEETRRGVRVRSKSRVPVSIDRRYASVDRIDNSIKCPHITLLIAPLSPRRFSAMASSRLSALGPMPRSYFLSLASDSSVCATYNDWVLSSRLIKRNGSEVNIVRA